MKESSSLSVSYLSPEPAKSWSLLVKYLLKIFFMSNREIWLKYKKALSLLP